MKNVNYDAGWRHLLGLPVMMEHLLRGFAGPVADLLDLSTLRELSAGWTEADPGTAAKARRRYGDGVWRAGYADGSGRSLVSLLEVQSRGDRGMAERTRRYEGVAYNRLRRQGAMDADGELRLVSIVVHTGRYPWTAPGGADRIEVTADGEAALPLRGVYVPLDARRLARKQLPARNLMATAFELTGGRVLADVAWPLRAMGSWLGSLGLDDPEEVVKTFAVWLTTTMPWFFPEDRALEMVGDFVGLEKQEEAMMALMEEQMKREKKLKAASRREGRQEGLQEGWQKGRVDTQLAMLRRQATLKFDADTGSRLGALLDGVSDQAAFDELSAAIVNGATPAGLLECAADARRRAANRNSRPRGSDET